MVCRVVRGCRFQFWKRKGSAVTFACVMVLLAALSTLLFVDAIESWAVSMSRTKGVAGVWVGPGPPNRGFLSPPEEYLLMPSPLVCQRAKPYLIVMVTTAPAHWQARQVIRETWGEETEVRGRRVMTLFMVGQSLDPGLSKQLVAEARDHGDVVQGRFLDSYANLTLKTLSLLGWVHRFCREVPFVAKVDDDVLFNAGALLHYLNRNHRTESDLYLGRVHVRVPPKRKPTSRHYLPALSYTPEVFPDYCSGTAYILSRAAARKILQAASTLPLPDPLPPEDVFVGLSALEAGIVPHHCPLFSGGPGVPYSRCCYQAMVSVHHTSPEEMVRFWTEVHSIPPCSWLSMKASLGLCKVRALVGM
ncbi:beta-1,3-galactosyltransferase 4 [Scleropages formosus]|uniref:beta-1,3-galactosyltransferase 4 n=1 Tax=Scleropages formosus TaxID=113540 RepID=UPI0008783A22|nr:beta-1,3-galactosyltransferase 4 [Scleropages formosus]